MIARAAFALAVLFMLPVTGSGETSELSGIRYNVRQEKSRVTFRFDGPVAYSAHKADSIITIFFRNVSVNSSRGQGRLSFVSGAVQRVDMRQAGRDSVVAMIRLRYNYQVEYSSSEDGHALYVDVIGGEQSAVRRSGAVKTPSTAITEKVSEAVPPSPVNTVLKSPEQEDHLLSITDPGQSVADRSEIPATELLLSIMFSLTVSSAGTIAVLWIYVRRTHGKQRGGPRHAEAVVQEAAPGNVSSPPLSTPVTREGPSVWSSHAELERSNPGLALAERFQRSRSELDFAIRLSSAPYPNGLSRELAAADAASLSGAQRTLVAKKLGVGRGELDLVANLSKMKEQAKEGNHD